MEPFDLRFLQACEEQALRKQELGMLLAQALGVSPDRLFYTWMNRKCEQVGSIPGTNWRHFFHGFECELHNEADGRHLRYEFGPHGRLDTVSGSAVSSFVMGSRAPWKEFSDLRKHFGDQVLKYQAFVDRLGRMGDLEPADPNLCTVLQHCTRKQPDGVTTITPPRGMTWESQVDLMVAGRPVISALGRQALVIASSDSSRSE